MLWHRCFSVLCVGKRWLVATYFNVQRGTSYVRHAWSHCQVEGQRLLARHARHAVAASETFEIVPWNPWLNRQSSHAPATNAASREKALYSRNTSKRASTGLFHARLILERLAIGWGVWRKLNHTLSRLARARMAWVPYIWWIALDIGLLVHQSFLDAFGGVSSSIRPTHSSSQPNMTQRKTCFGCLCAK